MKKPRKTSRRSVAQVVTDVLKDARMEMSLEEIVAVTSFLFILKSGGKA